MMIEATPKNVDWLLERLYMLKRDIEASSPKEAGTFILLTRTAIERRMVETAIACWINRKFGIAGYLNNGAPTVMNDRHTVWRVHGISIALMDLEA